MPELPYAGPTPGNDRLLIATGYDKWGMTHAVAAALAMSSRILGGHTQCASAWETWSDAELPGALAAGRLHAEVAIRLAGGWNKPLLSSPLRVGPDERLGTSNDVGRRPSRFALWTGTPLALSAVCTHLRGVVSWNNAER